MKKKKISLKDIYSEHQDMDYPQFHDYIQHLMDTGELSPVKSAKNNGRKPALPVNFWKYEEEVDYAEIYEELKYRFHPQIDTSYYRAHPERYAKDREKLQLLSDYLKDHSKLLNVKESMNERSFEIFHREKYFQKEGGLEFCRRVGIDSEKLAFYETSEPLSYYSCSKQSPQNIVIIENKDTFFDIRNYMNAGQHQILEKEFGTVIYGAGKGIWKTFTDYVNGAESYFMGENMLYYFGDLDYEGILIYEQLLSRNWRRQGSEDIIEIQIFKEAYEKMLDKARIIGFENLPDMKEKQNDHIGTIFLDRFSDSHRTQIKEILEAGKYIPQEILNEHDW